MAGYHVNLKTELRSDRQQKQTEESLTAGRLTLMSLTSSDTNANVQILIIIWYIVNTGKLITLNI